MSNNKKLRGRKKAERETMLVVDDASGIDYKLYNTPNVWADLVIFLGAPRPPNNFFDKRVKR